MGNSKKKPTQFVLEIDLSAVDGDPTEELSHALRYWAGNLKHYDLEVPVAETVYDSEYGKIGQWSLA